MRQVAIITMCAAVMTLACEEWKEPATMKPNEGDTRVATEEDDTTEPSETQTNTTTDSSMETTSESATDTIPETRGNLEDFPTDTDCIDNCQDACARVRECGGEQSTSFPLPLGDECAERCIRALAGPMWDDATVSFRCCAAQAECSAVRTCGGWLAHPATAHPCETLCNCMFSGADLTSLWQGLSAPKGYTFAHDAVAVSMEDHTTAFDIAYGARIHSLGRLAFLDLSNPISATAVDALLARETVVPTFRDGTGRVCAATNRLIARVADSELVSLNEAVAVLGLEPPRKLRFAKDLYIIESSDPWNATKLRPVLEAHLGLSIEQDMVRIFEKRGLPDDPYFARQWHLRNTGQEGLAVPGVDGRVSEAWDLTQGSPSTIIAILDDGVDIEHPDLSPNVVGSTNFPDDWRDQMAVGNFGWHGTSCAGVAAASGNNAEGVSGVCPQCSLHGAMLGSDTGLSQGGIQVTDEETADRFVTLVDAGAAVISNSWGIEGEDPRVSQPSSGHPALPAVTQSAFEYAETNGRGGKGTVIVFASGNSNMNVEFDPYASYETNVAVAAVDDQGLKSYYSNYGEKILISAPSNGGLLGIVTTATDVGGDLQQSPAYTANFGGTSSACPFIAGVVGLILSANPELTAAQVRAVLADSGRKIDPLHGKYDEDGHSIYYGYGLVDAYRAVRLAQTFGTDECQALESCRAPSDAPCGSSCDKSGACAFCRTEADCPAGVCQALPELGRSVCVSIKSGLNCPPSYEEVSGYCQPSRETCNLCGEAEACDGRDNDCNGVWDDGKDCYGGRCHQENLGCAEGKVCAGVNCSASCEVNEDCDSGRCKEVKDRYGTVHSDTKICYGGTGSCTEVCQAIASSNDDAGLQGFLDCMAPDTCDAAYGCISQM